MNLSGGLINEYRLSYITNKSYIRQKYINGVMVVDIITFIPVDYILLALDVPILFISWTRVIF